MSVYCDRSVYKPMGYGYVLKCTHKDITLWMHKTYPSIQGVKRMLLSRRTYEADIFYIYKYPEDKLVAIGLPTDSKDYWKKNTFSLKLLNDLNEDEVSEYVNKAKSFNDIIGE